MNGKTVEALFSPETQWIWTVVLGIALFFPVRKLIWVSSVRRAERKHGPTDEAGRQALRKRATVTSALLCFCFSVIYVQFVFNHVQGSP